MVWVYFQLISKPTRITSQSETVIDNIFTNIIDGKVVSGILITDVSDHLPVFAVHENYCYNVKETTTKKLARNRSKKALEALKEDLKNQNWDEIYVNDVSEAYDLFMKTFSVLYNKNCKLINSAKGDAIDKPWMTKGLRNAF